MKYQKGNENVEFDQDWRNNPGQPSITIPPPPKDKNLSTPIIPEPIKHYPKWRMYFTIAILVVINLLNYMDRYTISAVLIQIKDHFKISNAKAGLLQTIFIVFYLVFAPIAGYLGDRFNRKWIMIGGIFVWLFSVITSSVIRQGHNNYWWFLIARGMVGIGEACYSVLAPTVIADMFTSTARSTALMIFYVAVPCGAGLGFISAGLVARIDELTTLGLGQPWQWGLRVTPFFGIICIVLMIFIVFEPERGLAEKMEGATKELEKSGYFEDLWYLLKHPTFVTATLAFTAVCFVTGTLAFWAPTTIKFANCIGKENQCHPHLNTAVPITTFSSNCLWNGERELEYPREFPDVDLTFGIIVCVSGLVGVLTGSFSAMLWKTGNFCFRPCKSVRADAIICALGSWLSIAPMIGGLQTIRTVPWLSWTLIFLAITFVCLNWAIITDMLMYTIIPNRRSTATGVQTTFSHLFGDASGPWLVGLISDAIRRHRNCQDDNASFGALQLSLFLPAGAALVSAIMFTITIFVVKRDLEEFEAVMGKAKLQSDENEKPKPCDANYTIAYGQENASFAYNEE